MPSPAGVARAETSLGRVCHPMDMLGELVALLQDQIDPQEVPIHALMLQERHRLPKVRACIDFWAGWLPTM